MMMSEFIDRTGFEPTAKEYAKIEEAYYDFDGDKDAFCKAFVKDGGARKLCKARAAEIDRLNSLLLESERQYKKDTNMHYCRYRRTNLFTSTLDNFRFICLLSGSFQMDRAAFAYIILCPCRCSGNGGSKRRSRPNSVFVTQSFSVQS